MADSNQNPHAFGKVYSTSLGGYCSDPNICRCCQSPIPIHTEKTTPLPKELKISLVLEDISLKGKKTGSPHSKAHPRVQRVGEGIFDTIKFEGNRKNTLHISDGENFNGSLLQYHMHFPSEHKISRQTKSGKMKLKQYAGEVHFVFQDETTERIGVVGVFVEEGVNKNPVFEAMLNNLSQEPKEKKAPEMLDKLCSKHVHGRLIPSNQKIYYTAGSLTAPDSEKKHPRYGKGVHWVLMDTPIKASAEQIERFKQIIGAENNRPLQATQGRTIFAGKMKIDKQQMSFQSL